MHFQRSGVGNLAVRLVKGALLLAALSSLAMGQDTAGSTTQANAAQPAPPASG